MPLQAFDAAHFDPTEQVLEIDDALTRLAAEDAQAARLVELRYFGGLSVETPLKWSESRARVHTNIGHMPASAFDACFKASKSVPERDLRFSIFSSGRK